MILCPKCGKELDEEIQICEYCGENLIQEEEKNTEGTELIETEESIIQPTDESAASNKDNNPDEIVLSPKKSRKNVILISISIVLIIALIYSTFTYNQKRQKNYEANFKNTAFELIIETYSCYIMWDAIITVWGDAIKNNSNEEPAKQIEKWNAKGTIRERFDSKAKLDANMKKLKNPVKGYEEVYKKLFDVYNLYSEMYIKATSPSGTFDEYKKGINEKMSEFSNLYDKLKQLKPDIINALETAPAQ